MNEAPKTTLVDGSPVTPDHRELKANGQQKDYVVLSAEERAKGFVRPVRTTYRHVGPKPPQGVFRDLDAEEKVTYAPFGYAKYEAYPPSESPVVGRFWTQGELDRLRIGCGGETRMALELAETYARDPKFYGGTFCATCRAHFPVGEFVWIDGGEGVGT